MLHVYFVTSGMIVATNKTGVCYTFGHNFGMATIKIAFQVRVQSIQVRGFPEKNCQRFVGILGPSF